MEWVKKTHAHQHFQIFFFVSVNTSSQLVKSCIFRDCDYVRFERVHYVRAREWVPSSCRIHSSIDTFKWHSIHQIHHRNENNGIMCTASPIGRLAPPIDSHLILIFRIYSMSFVDDEYQMIVSSRKVFAHGVILAMGHCHCWGTTNDQYISNYTRTSATIA